MRDVRCEMRDARCEMHDDAPNIKQNFSSSIFQFLNFHNFILALIFNLDLDADFHLIHFHIS